MIQSFDCVRKVHFLILLFIQTRMCLSNVYLPCAHNTRLLYIQYCVFKRCSSVFEDGLPALVIIPALVAINIFPGAGTAINRNTIYGQSIEGFIWGLESNPTFQYTTSKAFSGRSSADIKRSDFSLAAQMSGWSSIAEDKCIEAVALMWLR